MTYWFRVVILLLIPVSASMSAEEDYQSEYVGQELRTIKSLSPSDIDELQTGGGWGLAKAAELNGFPGPAHILEMKNEIHLAGEQERNVQKIYNDMNAEAINLGEQLINLELELNDNFANSTINQTLLEISVQEIEQVRADLRIIHLSAHLQSASILTNEQVILYNNLRGYSEDPCLNIPEGHNADMWRSHNGCK